ncbi:MAG: AraC family transcriptional regulator [Opitutaceae bacterium]|nr:AraC family transcriptional regulator [Opitutaceae bacterium]
MRHPSFTPSLLAELAPYVKRLPSPISPLRGQTKPTPPLPENIICFQRRNTTELNRPQYGRALHHRHVLILPVAGQATVCVDDQDQRIGPGEALVILPFQFHHYRVSRPRRIQWLFVTFEYPAGVALESMRNQRFALGDEALKLLADFLKAYHQDSQVGSAALILALLLVHISPPTLNSDVLQPPDVTTALLARVNHAFQRHKPSLPSVAELARELGISSSHLRTRFRATCNVSLGRHLRTLRLERARGMLEISNTRIGDIAEQCGFSSLFSFSHAFKKAFGSSPSEIRKAAQAGSRR